MKLIVDIPDSVYENIINGTIETDGYFKANLRECFESGTLLPEHHGRLIDADTFQKYCFNKNFDKRLSDGGLATINFFLGLQPTIIEGSVNE